MHRCWPTLSLASRLELRKWRVRWWDCALHGPATRKRSPPPVADGRCGVPATVVIINRGGTPAAPTTLRQVDSTSHCRVAVVTGRCRRRRRSSRPRPTRIRMIHRSSRLTRSPDWRCGGRIAFRRRGRILPTRRWRACPPLPLSSPPLSRTICHGSGRTPLTRLVVAVCSTGRGLRCRSRWRCSATRGSPPTHHPLTGRPPWITTTSCHRPSGRVWARWAPLCDSIAHRHPERRRGRTLLGGGLSSASPHGQDAAKIERPAGETGAPPHGTLQSGVLCG